MEGFTYNNIFDTKGLEYLVIIGFFAILIPFWILLNKPFSIRDKVKRSLGILTSMVLRIPQGIYFSGCHTWAYLESSGEARIGLDDLLLHITGEVSVKGSREPGEMVVKGDELAVIENNGRKLRIISPVSGRVIATNRLLDDEPGFINKDPYKRGWIYRIKPDNWKAETASYHLAADATQWFELELARFRDFLSNTSAGASPDASSLILQDGGELADHPLARMPEGIWKEFQDKFLSNIQ